MKWISDKLNPAIPGQSSGSIYAQFTQWEAKNPGVLEINSPPDYSTLFAREAIQNSWDAAIEQAGSSNAKMDLTFQFKNLVDEQKQSFINALGLEELSQKAREGSKSLGEDTRISKQFGTDSSYSTIDPENDTPLEILTIHEVGTTGMDGSWNNPVDSKMWYAMLGVGFTPATNRNSRGGSFGFGKAALSIISGTRTVIAYTCFPKGKAERDTSRRLLGVTYWEQHKIGENSYTGWNRFGARTKENPELVEPFINEKADEHAELLGLNKRDPNKKEDIGTTFIIISPQIKPTDFAKAVERNWWPALVDNDGFKITIKDTNGNLIPLEPEKQDELKAFIKGYEIAKAGEEVEDSEEWFGKIETHKLKETDKRYPAGQLGLISNSSGWSWETAGNNKSIVALTRGPRMVVQYKAFGETAPYVRGTFVAEKGYLDDDKKYLKKIDELLKMTEPPTHDNWKEELTEDVGNHIAGPIAKEIDKGIKRNVRQFRDGLKPTTGEKDSWELKTLTKLLGNIFNSPGSGPGPGTEKDPRKISIHIPKGDQTLDVDPSDPENKIISTGVVKFGLMPIIEEDALKAEIKIEYVAVDGSSNSRDSGVIKAKITPPNGWEKIDERTYQGVVKRNQEENEFTIVSEPYDRDWMVSIDASQMPIESDMEGN